MFIEFLAEAAKPPASTISPLPADDTNSQASNASINHESPSHLQTLDALDSSADVNPSFKTFIAESQTPRPELPTSFAASLLPSPPLQAATNTKARKQKLTALPSRSLKKRKTSSQDKTHHVNDWESQKDVLLTESVYCSGEWLCETESYYQYSSINSQISSESWFK